MKSLTNSRTFVTVEISVPWLLAPPLQGSGLNPLGLLRVLKLVCAIPWSRPCWAHRHVDSGSTDDCRHRHGPQALGFGDFHAPGGSLGALAMDVLVYTDQPVDVVAGSTRVVELAPRELRTLIEQVSEEDFGHAQSFETLRDLYAQDALPDMPGSLYLASLLKMALSAQLPR